MSFDPSIGPSPTGGDHRDNFIDLTGDDTASDNASTQQSGTQSVAGQAFQRHQSGGEVNPSEVIVLDSSSESTSDDETPEVAPRRGGIVNGLGPDGVRSNCFLISAMQAIASSPHLRGYFHSNGNAIQVFGNAILTAIENGHTVEADTMHQFRQLCHEKGLVEGIAGNEDAGEALGRLLDHVGCDTHLHVQQRIVDYTPEATGNRPFDYEGQAAEYCTMEEHQAGIPRPTDIALTIEDGENMQEAINRYWGAETVDGFVVASDDGSSRISYDGVVRIKEIDMSSLPNTLTVSIRQFDGNYVTPTAVEEVYPFGTDGPRYLCVAAIQHRGDEQHYIARVRDADGTIVQADDQVVAPKEQGFNNFPGNTYVYIRDTQLTAAETGQGAGAASAQRAAAPSRGRRRVVRKRPPGTSARSPRSVAKVTGKRGAKSQAEKGGVKRQRTPSYQSDAGEPVVEAGAPQDTEAAPPPGVASTIQAYVPQWLRGWFQ